MPNTKKNHRLKRVIYYQQFMIDRHRMSIMPLKSRIDSLEHEIAMIEQNIKDEYRCASESIEGTMAFGSYVQILNDRLVGVRKFLKEARAKLEQELIKMQDMIAEKNTYTSVLEEYIESDKKDEEKKATDELYLLKDLIKQ